MRSPARWYIIASVLAAVLNLVYYYHYTARLVGPPSGRTFEGLVLGNLGFAAMLGALLYSVRRRFLSRAMNAIRVDPDQRRKLKEGERHALEQLQNLQRQVMQNAALHVSAVRRQAGHILRQTGMKRYLYAQVSAGPGGRGTRLSVGRREWGGRLQTWYYWHLMLGCLSILLILTHAGFRFGQPRGCACPHLSHRCRCHRDLGIHHLSTRPPGTHQGRRTGRKDSGGIARRFAGSEPGINHYHQRKICDFS